MYFALVTQQEMEQDRCQFLWPLKIIKDMNALFQHKYLTTFI